jgi:hypothetical protein
MSDERPANELDHPQTIRRVVQKSLRELKIVASR